MKIQFRKTRVISGGLLFIVCLLVIFFYRDAYTKQTQVEYQITEDGNLRKITETELEEIENDWLLVTDGLILDLEPWKPQLDLVSLSYIYEERGSGAGFRTSLYDENRTLLDEDIIELDMLPEVFVEVLRPEIESGHYQIELAFGEANSPAGLLVCANVSAIYTHYRPAVILLTILVAGVASLLVAVKIELKKPVYAAVFLLAVVPLVNYALFEFFTENLFNIRGHLLLMNLAFFYCFYFIIFAITNRFRFTAIFLNIILSALAIGEYYVEIFRGSPILIWDILSAQTAATVAGTYVYVITYHLILGIFALIALVALISQFPYKIVNWKKRLGVSAVLLLTTVIYISSFFQTLIPKYDLNINPWAPTLTFAENGFVLCTFTYMDYIKVDEPDGYSLLALAEIYDRLEAEEQLVYGQGITPTNLICIMNESLADLNVLGDFRVNEDYMPFMRSLTENTIKGNLYMPVFGAMTANSEYEFLTGNSMAYLPTGSVPYQFYVNNYTHSMVSNLKSLGYEAIAMHPYPGGNWNRISVFEHMGFDEFYYGDYHSDGVFGGRHTVRGYISDQSTYDVIIELVENKEADQPLFVFDVTMQNHGGYANPHYPSTIKLLDYDMFPQTEQYLSSVKESDEAFEYLLDYFSGVEEPTMIVMFGDHQPSVEEGFFEAVLGKPLGDLAGEEQLQQYITPFFIWTNYEIEDQYIDKLSSNYLPALVFETANIELPPYWKYLRTLAAEVPVMHLAGYYTKEDEFYSWANWTSVAQYPLFKDFYILQHNNIFDFRHRLDKMYTIEPE